MNVGVAVLASLCHIVEYRFHVTLRAGHRLMHAPKRVSRLVMIEFRNCADRPPCGCGMAVLAWHVQISVRAVRASRPLCLRKPRDSGERQEHHCNQIEHAPELQHDSPLRSLPPGLRKLLRHKESAFLSPLVKERMRICAKVGPTLEELAEGARRRKKGRYRGAFAVKNHSEPYQPRVGDPSRRPHEGSSLRHV